MSRSEPKLSFRIVCGVVLAGVVGLVCCAVASRWLHGLPSTLLGRTGFVLLGVPLWIVTQVCGEAMMFPFEIALESRSRVVRAVGVIVFLAAFAAYVYWLLNHA